ncbi:hypothetical protein AHF37_08476 [Paragonimus kellicotti]|nr:hypothetical protein AHF37_08476 [Paragonimus kellicotti]
MRILAWLDFPINIFCLGYYVLRLRELAEHSRHINTKGIDGGMSNLYQDS